jgi:hypothetical protein
MVCAIPAAAGRQAQVLAGIESGRQRPQPHEQNQEDGKPAPHLGFHGTRAWWQMICNFFVTRLSFPYGREGLLSLLYAPLGAQLTWV